MKLLKISLLFSLILSAAQPCFVQADDSLFAGLMQKSKNAAEMLFSGAYSFVQNHYAKIYVGIFLIPLIKIAKVAAVAAWKNSSKNNNKKSEKTTSPSTSTATVDRTIKETVEFYLKNFIEGNCDNEKFIAFLRSNISIWFSDAHQAELKLIGINNAWDRYNAYQNKSQCRRGVCAQEIAEYFAIDLKTIFFPLLNGETIVLKYGSLIKEDTQALVNAANEHLSHGGGIAAALAQAIPTLQEDSDKIPSNKQSFYGSDNVRCPVGQACATSVTGQSTISPNIKQIIHTVGPRGTDANKEKLLRKAYKNCLKQADALGLETIALPPLSIGIFGYPMQEATEIAVKTIVDYFNPLLNKNRINVARSLKEVRLIIWDGDKTKEQQFAEYKKQLDFRYNLK